MWRNRVHISFGFCLLAGWFAAVNGWRPLVTVLGAAAVHEAGHWVALRALGARIRALRIGPLGAVLETDARSLSYGRELAAVLAGPGANLLCAWVLTLAGCGQTALIGAHLVLGAFNLLPVGPLDGGRALRLALSWRWGPAGEEVARWVSAAASLAAAAGLGALICYTGGSLWLLPAMGGLLAGAAEDLLRGKAKKGGLSPPL